ncbi:MAG: diguanylate phosphodiesterase [Candidatus Dactylopiibacterium carminicum]|uniref:Diguanylate phosphodiesterase n=1 Tax=Candidatus Dactylopiibacterium carminicum TaxID=857335 RepID=A0A272EWX6_9RHOO|nr:EAL domain-containing protein [Candidatus Dactylopiibacterium carminicum]KAF7599901.1 EAL domain-containing protein [Candidatus Dactylopiibacterium carminicum]PAS94160.1 MAG: diguanylate phosphodiesterase [Candidatus Dactylopiibacterium carminicum]PAS96770.1 MAG: diguanylate phosphodiesterase [Candidatus Dactylopiibacterium carminicum]PAS99902.1 MAG: diguanylate phosphodiesterase [Candidatus Dactylopiibacterium carminicum]
MRIDSILAFFEHWAGRHCLSQHSLRFDDRGAVGCFGEYELHSVFQPLFGAQDPARALAFEALARVRNQTGLQIPPQIAFDLPQNPAEIIFFDRLCRMVHVVNFVTQPAHEHCRLFLNVNGRHLSSIRSGTHGEAFEGLLRQAGLMPQRVVLEILESSVDDLDLLIAAVNAYQQRGFQVAIDDFGARHSNFDRLWQLSPDIVKLDRQLIRQAQHDSRAARILPKLVEIIHDLEAQVVCEGIETHTQWQIARDAGVDLVQGFLFARPQADLQFAGRPVPTAQPGRARTTAGSPLGALGAA